MLKPVLTEAPADKPIRLEEVKRHLGIYDTTEFDAWLNLYIDVAESYLDGYSGVLGAALITQTWRQDYDGFPSATELRLPRIQPVTSITSVTYYDSDNAQQTFSSGSYSLFTDHRGAYLKLAENVSWPDTYTRDDAVSVTFQAGYGGQDDVPAAAKAIMLLLIAHWFANREPIVLERNVTPETLPFGVDALISKFKPPIY